MESIPGARKKDAVGHFLIYASNGAVYPRKGPDLTLAVGSWLGSFMYSAEGPGRLGGASGEPDDLTGLAKSRLFDRIFLPLHQVVGD